SGVPEGRQPASAPPKADATTRGDIGADPALLPWSASTRRPNIGSDCPRRPCAPSVGQTGNAAIRPARPVARPRQRLVEELVARLRRAGPQTAAERHLSRRDDPSLQPQLTRL